MGDGVAIVTDSSCDLPEEIVAQYRIGIVPLTVHFGDQVFADGELSREEFWQRARGPHPPKTSQPPVGVFERVFGARVAQGEQVVCLTITGQHSGTYSTACLAARRFGGLVHVFDSLSLSLGLGMQALAAARAAHGGAGVDEILGLLASIRERSRVLIVLDTLENLRRGGRADAFIAIAERMTHALNIKVIINLVEGQLKLLGAARSFKSSLRRVAEVIEALGPLEELAVVHALNPQVALEMAADLARRVGIPLERIWVSETGAVLSTHGGPGVVGAVAIPRQSRGPSVPQ